MTGYVRFYLRAIHTPGHTTDHLCFWLEEEQSLFAGDTILGQGTTEFEDLYDYLNSLKLILNLSPKRIYPGHGPIVENPREAIEYYISHRQQRNDQILAALKQHSHGLDPNEITGIVYKVRKRIFSRKIVHLILKMHIQIALHPIEHLVLC